jgi:hypothetical protein
VARCQFIGRMRWFAQGEAISSTYGGLHFGGQASLYLLTCIECGVRGEGKVARWGPYLRLRPASTRSTRRSASCRVNRRVYPVRDISQPKASGVVRKIPERHREERGRWWCCRAQSGKLWRGGGVGGSSTGEWSEQQQKAAVVSCYLREEERRKRK